MNLSSDFSKRWDLLKDIPFFLPIGDGAASHIGAGCTIPNHISLSIGTTGAMRVLLKSFNKRIKILTDNGFLIKKNKNFFLSSRGKKYLEIIKIFHSIYGIKSSG